MLRAFIGTIPDSLLHLTLVVRTKLMPRQVRFLKVEHHQIGRFCFVCQPFYCSVYPCPRRRRYYIWNMLNTHINTPRYIYHGAQISHIFQKISTHISHNKRTLSCRGIYTPQCLLTISCPSTFCSCQSISLRPRNDYIKWYSFD